jgi:hypothetical protein
MYCDHLLAAAYCRRRHSTMNRELPKISTSSKNPELFDIAIPISREPPQKLKKRPSRPEAFRNGICKFTSKQYIEIEYGDLAKTSVGSNQRRDFQEVEQRFFQELEQRFTVLAVLADNERLLADESKSFGG